MRISIYLCLFFFASFFSLRAQIVINEISYNSPESGNDSLEYIEIYNAGTGHVDLTGWHFTGGIEDTFPSIHLNGGEFYVTAINANAMASVFGINVHQWSAGALNNSGETIRLVDAGGNLIDSVFYDDLDPWPLEPDGLGPSLELVDATLDNNDGANWQASGGATGVIINGHEVFGTPGAENSSGGTTGPSVIVNLAHLRFEPENVVVAIGDSVRWVNNEAIPHNVNGLKTTFLGNVEDFFSGVPAVGPWQYDHEFTIPGLNHYRCDLHFGDGMVGTVSVYDPNNYTDFPLEHLRLTDGTNGSYIFDGVPTRVTGVVHGINFQPTGYSFYIINQDNVGINVFSFDPGSYVVTEGDLITVSGVIDQFNGLLEIVPDTIEVLLTGENLVSPDLVTDLTEEIEASHVVFGTYSIDSIVATGTSGLNVYVTHTNGTKALIRVDADSGINQSQIEQSNIVRGIGTQFDPSFPYTSGYQILALEFQTISGIAVIDQDAIRMSPNPVNDKLIFDADINMVAIEVYSLDGQLMDKQQVHGLHASMTTDRLSPGLYLVRAITEKGLWSSKLAVIR
jgi:plastocyanin